MKKFILFTFIISFFLFVNNSFSGDKADLLIKQINQNWKTKNYKKIESVIDGYLKLHPNSLVGIFAKIQYLVLFGNSNNIQEIESLSRKLKRLGDSVKWANDSELELEMTVFLYDTMNVKQAIARGAIGPGLSKKQINKLHEEFKQFPLSSIMIKLSKIDNIQ